MNSDLKKRWNAVCKQIKESPLKRENIRTGVKIGKTTMSCYTQKFRGNPLYPAYVTESMTKRFENFFNPEEDVTAN